MEESKPNSDFPNEETKYQQTVEEMKQLIPFLKEEMKSCPNQDLVFTLIETVDFYSLKGFLNLNQIQPQVIINLYLNLKKHF